MGKKKSVRKRNSLNNTKVKEIENKRNGGQIALRGFSYQLIYSCYKVLEFIDSENKTIRFEGIEDIDTYKSLAESNDYIEHIQLKYSKGKEDASFFDYILKNYLEVYLASDKKENRYFKLVYDLEIAKGNLSKLIYNNLDDKSKEFWINKVNKIKEKQPKWKWSEFRFDEFYNKLKFQYFPLQSIMKEIQNLIIRKFQINTGSEQLFLNSLFYNIFHMAKERDEINYSTLLEIVQNTKDYISKGHKNPAYAWIDKINFNIEKTNNESQYFEGKKPTVDDIVNNLPVRRPTIENSIKKSIEDNNITVIKSSSGQGKTTLAWQVANDLKEEYCIYKLNWCKDTKEINNIVEYFNSRLKLGEKLLIIIDKLDNDTQEWNKIAQMLAEKIKMNYKILVTAREEDWYQFAGDQSSIGSLNIITLSVEYNEAETIFKNLKQRGKVHESISNWQSIWELVKNRGVLIEYIYLLTHGEMLQERISHQLKRLSTLDNANVKNDILRLVSLADVIGVKIKISNLISKIRKKYTLENLNEIMKSIENEYLIKFNEDTNFVEGLHPVRSKYILDILHDFEPIRNTFLELVYIIDETYVEKVYSQVPEFVIDDKDKFYDTLASDDVKKSYKYIGNAIKGIFSGTILNYYKSNKSIVDDADERGGLILFLNEINPWNNKDFGAEVKTLKDFNKLYPDNENIKYLLNLVNSIEKHNIKESDYYIYSYYLFQKLKGQTLKRNNEGFFEVVNWLRRIDKRFNILSNIDLLDIWEYREEWDFEELINLMYIFHIVDENKHIKFIKENKNDIFSYLKVKTNTLILEEKEDKVHIKYILLQTQILNANEESVRRVNSVCKLLPIYKFYCTDAIKPKIEAIENFQFIDEAHKEMPFENVILSFNSDLNSLWNKSIVSQYEFSSVYEWQYYWINLRKELVEFLKLNVKMFEILLKKQKLTKQFIEEILNKSNNIHSSYIRQNSFPNQERPFEEGLEISGEISKFKSGYFQSMDNYCLQFSNIVDKNATEHMSSLALINLKNASAELEEIQKCFTNIINHTFKYFDIDFLEDYEKEWIDRLIRLIEYYKANKLNSKNDYNRELVKRWHEEKDILFMKSVNEVINYAQDISEFTIIKPVNIIREGLLNIVPIVVSANVIKDATVMGFLVAGLVNFVNMDINYVLILIKDDEEKIQPYGIKINRNYLEYVKDNIDSLESINIDKMNQPLPYEIKEEYLSCFEERFIIKENIEGKRFKEVQAILFELWKYDKYRDYLNDEDEVVKEYILENLDICRNNIDNYLNTIIENSNFDKIDKLIELKADVIDKNGIFSDKEINWWINILYY